MGLIDRGRRARAKQARAEREAAILDAARHLFTVQPFDEVSLETVAKRAKVPQGTPSMYFGGKDELFMRVAGEALEAWLGRVATELEGAKDAAGAASVCTRELVEDETLARLLGTMHQPLERLAELSAATLFHERIAEGSAAIAEALVASGLAADREAADAFVRRFLAVVAGLEQASRERGVRWQCLADSRFSRIKLDFGRETERVVVGLLELAREPSEA